MSRLAARVRTGTTLAVAAAALVWLHARFPGGWVVLAVVAALAALSVWELDHMGSFAGRGYGLPLGTACVALLAFELRWVAAGTGLAPATELGLLYGLAGAAVLVAALARRLARARAPMPDTLAALGLALWLLPPLFALLALDRRFGVPGLAVLVVLAKIGDNAGFFVGRAMGRRHPFPNISPGKTVAGCVASLVAGVVAGAGLLPWTLGTWDARGIALGAVLGGLVNVAAQAGDLSESWVKRRAGVKDSSALVGPSGGVLDVIDSVLLAAPVALLAWSWAY
jgi:phosphatidate cytidylyltransferase